jgi:hypothetical protein
MWPTAWSWTVFKPTLPQGSRSDVTYVVPVVVNCSYYTPDDGYGKYPKHVEWSCNKIKILVLHLVGHFVCMYIENDARKHEPERPNAVCTVPPEDEQVMLEICRGPRFLINWMKSASRWFHYTDILWCTVNKTLSNYRTFLFRTMTNKSTINSQIITFQCDNLWINCAFVRHSTK